jgi:hypothetical protein
MRHDPLLTLSMENIAMTTRTIFAAAAALGFFALTSMNASAVECAAGVYREGCVGPRGAAVVRKPAVVETPAVVHPGVVHPPVAHPPEVTCARGVVREGCVGPHGEAVIRR